mmetsp:Transcript_65799/g.150744  ORF Transcript_65799/g.150744 Transcript_65799/m.150744 type:complete len:210 (-) Transcript_65799:13-642(-)
MGRVMYLTSAATRSSTRMSGVVRKPSCLKIDSTNKGSCFRDSGRISCPAAVEVAHSDRYANSIFTVSVVNCSCSFLWSFCPRSKAIHAFLNMIATTESTQECRNTLLNEVLQASINVWTRIILWPYTVTYMHASCMATARAPSGSSSSCVNTKETEQSEDILGTTNTLSSTPACAGHGAISSLTARPRETLSFTVHSKATLRVQHRAIS